ncbi:nucleoside recognition domain protein [Caldicellulosiruptor saccharolyticus DSM 8903]|uniref:Nucleoside recognition domain protein n=1 Tax=Caldicellulosiruptor saccharolyticus (strain ATCC 43494 / DSM 8903 / Tp8T 6331) TaxID=351627 RepID=A4XGM5_CALS8|nr:nucleoside recognition domain-containing protein [Caldicellulosiruptor saccharolyticus]ABP66060.2 nucleoside recognition domain protein [Caldicellulosiruptor saccharolyticus DSM 8903]
MNAFWLFMILFSILVQVINGDINKITTILFSAPKTALQIFVTIACSIILWSGFLRLVQDSGLIKILERFLKPILTLLFKTKNEEAFKWMSTNIIANLLGLGNAATPAGIKAMEELSKENSKDLASSDMILFVILNTCSIQLIPTTVIILRHEYGSENPTVVVFPILFVSLVGLFFGVIFCKVISRVLRR